MGVNCCSFFCFFSLLFFFILNVADCLCFAFSHALSFTGRQTINNFFFVVPYLFSLPLCQSKTTFHLKGAIFLLSFSLLQHVWALHWPEASPVIELGTEQNIKRHFFWLGSSESFVLLGQKSILVPSLLLQKIEAHKMNRIQKETGSISSSFTLSFPLYV